jgi:1-deoxy-D-xylulose-5-phosphate synthase
MWDLSILGVVPGLRVAAPRDEPTLREELREAVACADGPTVLRYPKTALGDDLPAVRRIGSLDVLREPIPGAEPVDADGQVGSAGVLLVAVGAVAGLALEVAERAAAQGIAVSVVDPRWVLPVSDELVDYARRHRLVVTVEDSSRTGGVGSQVSQALRDAEIDIPTREIGIPREFLAQGKVSDVQSRIGFTAQDITRRVVEWAARVESSADREPVRAPDGTSGV